MIKQNFWKKALVINKEDIIEINPEQIVVNDTVVPIQEKKKENLKVEKMETVTQKEG